MVSVPHIGPPIAPRTWRKLIDGSAFVTAGSTGDVSGNVLRGLGSWGNFPDMSDSNEMITR